MKLVRIECSFVYDEPTKGNGVANYYRERGSGLVTRAMTRWLAISHLCSVRREQVTSWRRLPAVAPPLSHPVVVVFVSSPLARSLPSLSLL